MRKLPAYAPLAVAVLAFGSIAFFWVIPRNTEAADTFLEAMPFVIGAVGLLLVPFSERARIRTWGAVAAGFVAVLPVLWPLAVGGLLVLSEEREHATLYFLTTPEDLNETYVVLIPAPSSPERFFENRAAWDTVDFVVEREGQKWIRVEAKGVYDRGFSIEGGNAWGESSWGDRAATPRLEAGNSTVVIHAEIRGGGDGCGGSFTVIGEARPDGTGFARGVSDNKCR